MGKFSGKPVTPLYLKSSMLSDVRSFALFTAKKFGIKLFMLMLI